MARLTSLEVTGYFVLDNVVVISPSWGTHAAKEDDVGSALPTVFYRNV